MAMAYSDLILGATNSSGSDPNTGVVYVIYGKSSGFTDVDLASTDLAATARGFRVLGADADDGISRVNVSSAGDVNGDGFEDLLLGLALADGADNSKSAAGDGGCRVRQRGRPIRHQHRSGRLHDVRQGLPDFRCRRERFPGQFCRLRGRHQRRRFDDLIIGAPVADGQGNARDGSGEAVVLFGKASGFGNIDLATVDIAASGQGFRIYAPTAEMKRAGRCPRRATLTAMATTT